ncbi:MAG: 4Fe-4S binding protein [Thermodesulfobacteriota bacterium]
MKKPSLTTWRRAFQIFVAVAFIVIPLLNRSRYSMVYGNFLSFHMFGIPLADPLAVLQLTIKNIYFTVDNLIGTVLPLILALVLGTVFCSWVCPYGLFSEWTQKLSRKVMPRSYQGLPLLKNGFPFKLAVFAAGFVGFFIFSTTPVLNQLSTAAWYARFFQYLFGQDFVSLCYLFLLGLLFIEFVAQKRLWCRYICPQSILIILTKLLNRKRLQVAFADEKCICRPGYERCDMACSLNLHPKTLSDSLETECSNCGECVVACKKMGKALTFDFQTLGDLKTGWLPSLLRKSRKVFCRTLLVAVLAGIGFLLFKTYEKMDFPERGAKIEHKLLSDKKIVWKNKRIGSMELLTDGTIVARGGEWPLNGSRNWQWQPIDEQGSFKVIPVPDVPESYTTFKVSAPIHAQAEVLLEHSGQGLSEDFPAGSYQIDQLTEAKTTDDAAAASVEGRVVLDEYADKTYILVLHVKDPKGLIKKVETKGDHISMEVMLTNVKRWINSPQIIVSEGEAPQLPFKTYMNVIFHDGHTERMEFETGEIFDRRSEVFDDPWF